tara:strand:+ start:790 stop:1251 length:462 start_codon:yes stop_codon:yes gene_type:complete
MSYDTHRTYAYIQSGKQLRLYKIVRSAGRIIDNNGRITGGTLDDIIYPDEAITNGLRIEYTAIEKPFVDEDPETTANSSLTEQTSPKEATHVNLNRMLSLAVVDYVKAQVHERAGNLELKEYYMREFWKKVSDNESNKNKMYIANTIKTFAVK